MILPKEREAALERIVAVAIQGGIGIEHPEILDGMFCQTREIFCPKTIKAAVVMNHEPVGKIRDHAAAGIT
jgi:hypothetical protein